MKKINLAHLPYHVLFIGLYPVLFLWLHNVNQIPAFAVPTSLYLALGVMAAVFVLSLVIYRNLLKAGLVSTIFLALFFSYGHFYVLLDQAGAIGHALARHRYTLALWALIFAGLAWLIWRTRSELKSVNAIVNVILGFLVLSTLVQLGMKVKGADAWNAFFPPAAAELKAHNPPADAGPGRDVYYIISDSYARQDDLKNTYDYDNTEFLKQLRDLGFIIPDCTQSNYDETVLSLSSSLNMVYQDDLGITMGDVMAQNYEGALHEKILNSAVLKNFENMGYQTVTFKSIYPFIEIPDATYHYDVEETQSPSQKLETLNFQYLFLKTTLMRPMTEWSEASPEVFATWSPAIMAYINPRSDVFKDRVMKQYDQNLYLLQKLQDTAAIPGKKFVYAHLFVTHQPFVFTTDGGVRWPVHETPQGYRDQVIYFNKRIIPILKTIIETSNPKPVIVLQGDHSYTKGDERPKILNAYYLPDGGDKQLYDQISPVNTFRLIFNAYFNGNYPFLPDKSYVQDWDNRVFKFIPDSCVGLK
ncbi:MAG: hypothetical protein LWX83_02960 [Anaerolineae bacterium]|nr:hypothetical protein [Anaerolineae bacterium]